MSLVVHTWGDKSLPPIFCVHGWASSAKIFKPLADLFKDHFHFICVDLPGYGESSCDNAEHAYDNEILLNSIMDAAPDNATWMGWSLGGMLALQAANKYPHRIKHLITLCSNAHFIASKQWPNAVPQPLYDGFMESIDDIRVTLRRFSALSMIGEKKGMLESIKWMQNEVQTPNPTSDVLKASLTLLGQIDNRKLYKFTKQRCLHILATDDAIVPNKLSQDINKLNPAHMVSFVPNGSHGCLVSHTQSVANGILTFMEVNA